MISREGPTFRGFRIGLRRQFLQLLALKPLPNRVQQPIQRDLQRAFQVAGVHFLKTLGVSAIKVLKPFSLNTIRLTE